MQGIIKIRSLLKEGNKKEFCARFDRPVRRGLEKGDEPDSLDSCTQHLSDQVQKVKHDISINECLYLVEREKTASEMHVAPHPLSSKMSALVCFRSP